MSKISRTFRLKKSVIKLISLAQFEINKNRGNGMKKISQDKVIEIAIEKAYGSSDAKIETLRDEAKEYALRIQEINERIDRIKDLEK